MYVQVVRHGSHLDAEKQRNHTDTASQTRTRKDLCLVSFFISKNVPLFSPMCVCASEPSFAGGCWSVCRWQRTTAAAAAASPPSTLPLLCPPVPSSRCRFILLASRFCFNLLFMCCYLALQPRIHQLSLATIPRPLLRPRQPYDLLLLYYYWFLLTTTTMVVFAADEAATQIGRVAMRSAHGLPFMVWHHRTNITRSVATTTPIPTIILDDGGGADERGGFSSSSFFFLKRPNPGFDTSLLSIPTELSSAHQTRSHIGSRSPTWERCVAPCSTTL